MIKSKSRQEKTTQEKPFIGPNVEHQGEAQEGVSRLTPPYKARKGVEKVPMAVLHANEGLCLQ
jgi:hypothetical protein